MTRRRNVGCGLLRRCLFFLLLAGVLIPASVLAQPAAEPGGSWEGAIRLPTAELRVQVDLRRGDDGAWSGDIDIPQQGARDLPLGEVRVEGHAVSFKISGVPGDPTFRGSLAAGGSHIEGDFTQGGQTFPFRLARPAQAGSSAPVPGDAELAAHLREHVAKVLADWKVPGLALAVVRDGRVILAEGYGFRDLEKKLPVTPETLFAIGSSTKAFTTTGLGLLVEDGKLEWDKPVRTYLPAFKLHDPFATEEMTPRDLVTHRSGLPRHDLMWYGSTLKRTELVSRLADLEPSAPFRTRFQYQNLMFMTAGYLTEQVSGRSWEDFLRERILAPLGMTSSNFSVEDMKAVENRALAYREKDKEEGGGIEEVPLRNLDAVGPAGSINSNVLDMAKWVQFQLGDGTVDGKAVVSAATLQELHRPQMLVDGGSAIAQLLTDEDVPMTAYGLGWFVQPYRGHLLVHHGGNIDGFAAFVAFLPKDELGLVVLTNLNGNLAPYVVAWHTFDRLLGLPEKDWNGRLKARRDEVLKAAEEAEKASTDERKTGTKPDHALDEYAGVYAHPSYGDLRIERQGKGLAFSYNGLQSPLEHWHYEVFKASEGLAEGTKITFLTNVRGEVDRLALPLEPTVPEIVFTRKPPEALSDPEELRKFVGEYELSGQVATVALRGEKTLTVTVPGQPTYELVPARGTEFNLKGVPGFSVRFELEKGEVVAASFLQPNGTFRARRKM